MFVKAKQRATREPAPSQTARPIIVPMCTVILASRATHDVVASSTASSVAE